MNEEHRQMKKNSKMKIQKSTEDQQQQKPSGRSLKQVPSLGVLLSPPLNKSDYRNVINITFISNIVLHMVLISTFNKDNG